MATQHYPITPRFIKTFLTRRKAAELIVPKSNFVVPRKGILTSVWLDTVLVPSFPDDGRTLYSVNFSHIGIIGSDFCLFAPSLVAEKITLCRHPA